MSTENDPDKQEGAGEIKTAADLKLEALEKRLADIEARHKAEVDELMKANRELWAAAHPAKPAEPPQPSPAPAGSAAETPAEDVGYKRMADMLGLKEE